MKITVNSQESKDRILTEVEYVKNFKLKAYPKKRGHIREYTLDPNKVNLLVNIKPNDIIIGDKFGVQVDSESERQEVVKQSRYIHNYMVDVWLKRKKDNRWVGLDSDKASTLMHLYLYEEEML